MHERVYLALDADNDAMSPPVDPLRPHAAVVLTSARIGSVDAVPRQSGINWHGIPPLARDVRLGAIGSVDGRAPSMGEARWNDRPL
ncbi:hypothetical protein [Nocardia bhagyanarayanae]|uniref:hypothetical protein n=1 Tax=Nocardia bhagyanarayanae TaxID=1215925 RepID=UPI001FE59D7E|nr:hypothetical protein [Nocardia bhagyanarayanae]